MVNKKLFMAFCGILADKDDDGGCWLSDDKDDDVSLPSSDNQNE